SLLNELIYAEIITCVSKLVIWFLYDLYNMDDHSSYTDSGIVQDSSMFDMTDDMDSFQESEMNMD
ncbi:Hypothetical predicted protein, partial [Mytilus galloprovincialis]